MYVSSEVSSNFLPETMPALFTKMVTTPTWALLAVMMMKKYEDDDEDDDNNDEEEVDDDDD